MGRLLALCLLMCALPGAARAGAEAEGPTLTGTVYLPDGRPAAKLELLADGWHLEVVGGKVGGASFQMPPFTLRTDARGRYRVRLSRHPGDEPAPAGATYRLHLHLLLLALRGAGWARLKMEVGPDQSRVEQEIRLLRGDRVVGTVLGYPGGRPIAAAQVTVVMDEGITYSVPISHAVTDKRGRFRVPIVLPPGEYRVGAAAEGYGLISPYVPDPHQTAQLLTITLSMVRDLRLTGRVLSADGMPVSGKRVLLQMEHYLAGSLRLKSGLSVNTDPCGRFSAAYRWEPGEFDRWWGEGCTEAVLSVGDDGRESNAVLIDPTARSQVEAVLKLK